MAADRPLPSPGRFTQLYGLMVDDAARYADYRAGMTPILHAPGGAFGLDLEVARVLKSAPDGGPSAFLRSAFPAEKLALASSPTLNTSA